MSNEKARVCPTCGKLENEFCSNSFHLSNEKDKQEEYKCADCGTVINEGEFKTFGICDACWDKHYPMQPRYKLTIDNLRSELAKQKELNAELVKCLKEMTEQIQSLGYYPECLSHELESLIKKSNQ